jgi:hypothetical protein
MAIGMVISRTPVLGFVRKDTEVAPSDGFVDVICEGFGDVGDVRVWEALAVVEE